MDSPPPPLPPPSTAAAVVVMVVVADVVDMGGIIAEVEVIEAARRVRAAAGGTVTTSAHGPRMELPHNRELLVGVYVPAVSEPEPASTVHGASAWVRGDRWECGVMKN